MQKIHTDINGISFGRKETVQINKGIESKQKVLSSKNRHCH